MLGGGFAIHPERAIVMLTFGVADDCCARVARSDRQMEAGQPVGGAGAVPAHDRASAGTWNTLVCACVLVCVDGRSRQHPTKRAYTHADDVRTRVPECARSQRRGGGVGCGVLGDVRLRRANQTARRPWPNFWPRCRSTPSKSDSAWSRTTLWTRKRGFDSETIVHRLCNTALISLVHTRKQHTQTQRERGRRGEGGSRRKGPSITNANETVGCGI